MPTPPTPFPPDVLDAIARGKPLEAIKRLRRAGIGLAEAKALLDAHQRDDAPRTSSFRPSPHTDHTFGDEGRVLPAEVLEALQRGDKMGAIELLRERTGIGLKEARSRIEAAAGASVPSFVHPRPSPTSAPESLSLSRRGLGQGEVPHSNASAWLVVGLLAVLAAYYLLVP